MAVMIDAPNAPNPKLAELAVVPIPKPAPRRLSKAVPRLSIANLPIRLAHIEDDSVIAGSFRHLKDSVEVQKKKRTVNDGEAHANGSTSEGLRRKIGAASGGGAVDEDTAVPDAEALPFSSCVRRIKSFKAAANAIIFMKRLSSDGEDVTFGEKNRGLSFGVIEIRDYPMTLGDQICKKGLPVSLGWEYSEYPALPVDEYETNRPRRRPLAQLALSPEKRKSYLTDVCGVCKEDQAKAQREILTVRRRRAAEKEAAMNPGGPPDVSCCVVS